MGNEVVPFNPSELLKQETEITDRDFYQVYDPRLRRKKKVPSARVYNNWAKEAGIKTKIVNAGCDSEKAWAHVKGWIGKEATPILQREARVTILWKIEFESLVWDAIADKEKKKPYTVGPDGYPILKNPADQLALIRQLSRIKRFGERTAVTKAEAIVEKKLLGVEYREPEEIRHEKREVQAVSEAREETAEETGRVLEPGAEAVGKKSEGDPLPVPARTPGSDEILKRCPSRKVLYRGKTYKTAGINADQLKRIWDAARGPDAERARELLERFGLGKSVNLITYLREDEADEMIKALGTQPLSNGHPAEMPV